MVLIIINEYYAKIVRSHTNLFLFIVIAAGCCQAAHTAWSCIGPTNIATVSASTAVPMPGRLYIPKVSNPYALAACGEGVAILCNLDCRHVHRVELAVPSILVGDMVVRRYVKTECLGDARALMLKANDLGYQPVALLDWVHPCGLHLVLGITIPIVPCRIHGD
jgi:hypothetical protein